LLSEYRTSLYVRLTDETDDGDDELDNTAHEKLVQSAGVEQGCRD